MLLHHKTQKNKQPSSSSTTKKRKQRQQRTTTLTSTHINSTINKNHQKTFRTSKTIFNNTQQALQQVQHPKQTTPTTTMSIVSPQQVLDFWFSAETKPKWFVKSAEFDNLLKETFGPTVEAGAKNELYNWRATPAGRVAEVIVLDQFSRNIYRDTPQTFANDALALSLTLEAIRLGVDDELENKEHRWFLYMPIMHSESKKIHEDFLAVWDKLDNEYVKMYEMKHKVIIDRFDRYPHRNAVLGRVSTAEEIEFLAGPDSSF